MRKEDLELLLIAGRDIAVGDKGLVIKQLKLKDMLDCGWQEYWRKLSVLLFDFDALIEKTAEKELQEFLRNSGKSDYLLFSAAQDTTFCSGLAATLNYLSSPEWSFQVIDKMAMLYYDYEGEPIVLDATLLEQIINVLEIMYCLKKPEDLEETEGLSPKVLELLKKRKEAEKKLQKARKLSDTGASDSAEGVGFADLVSIVAAKGNGLSLFNLWDLTYYQLYNQFLRLQKMEAFNLEFQSSIAAMKASNNLAHWMGRL